MAKVVLKKNYNLKYLHYFIKERMRTNERIAPHTSSNGEAFNVTVSLGLVIDVPQSLGSLDFISYVQYLQSHKNQSSSFPCSANVLRKTQFYCSAYMSGFFYSFSLSFWPEYF